MSEAKIKELHQQLSEKLISEAKARADKMNPSILVKLNIEIVRIRRANHEELQAFEKMHSRK